MEQVNMDFSEALLLIRNSPTSRVSRESWNTEFDVPDAQWFPQYIFVVENWIHSGAPTILDDGNGSNHMDNNRDFIAVCFANNRGFAPWTPSQEDLFAHDWFEVIL